MDMKSGPSRVRRDQNEDTLLYTPNLGRRYPERSTLPEVKMADWGTYNTEI